MVRAGGDLMAAAFILAMNDHTALLVFIIVLVAQLGIPIPTFPVLISAGALATGRMSFMSAVAAAAGGSVLGSRVSVRAHDWALPLTPLNRCLGM
jgi:membrane protein DedA with SNARE-associated domain